MKFNVFSLLLFLAPFCFQQEAVGQASVFLDSFTIGVGTQEVLTFSTSGDETVDGANIVLVFGDGGAELGGVDTSPSLVDIDLLSGTIFSGGSQGPNSGSDLAPIVSVDGPTTTTDGLLGTLILDTSDLSVGDTFSVQFTDGTIDTIFALGATPVETTFSAATVTVVAAVPEPSSMALVAFVGLAFAGRRVRR